MTERSITRRHDVFVIIQLVYVKKGSIKNDCKNYVCYQEDIFIRLLLKEAIKSYIVPSYLFSCL